MFEKYIFYKNIENNKKNKQKKTIKLKQLEK